MERGVLFIGPVGSGKTQAIASVSQIDVVDTDETATDETRLMKSRTTVAMDVGTVNLGDGDKLRLYGAPGQERFDFMWDILLEQSHAVVVLLNHCNPDPLSDLDFYLKALEARLVHRPLPLVIGVTHTDLAADASMHAYRQWIAQHHYRFVEGIPPVLSLDARQPEHMQALLVTVAALLEMTERYPAGAAQTH